MQTSSESLNADHVVTLDNLQAGQVGRVIRLSSSDTGMRLLSMGILPGSRIAVVRRRSRKGTMYLRVNKVRLALRPSEGESIYVAL